MVDGTRVRNAHNPDIPIGAQMTLTDQARNRLADIVELQPTKNAELQERWGMDSGSEVHQYLEGELQDYYYRDDESLIRATDEAASLVDVEPGVTAGQDGTPDSIRVPALAARVFDILPGPDERSQSVVSVLHEVRDTFGIDPTTEEVGDALDTLKRKGVVEVVHRTVPTYRQAVDGASVTVNISTEPGDANVDEAAPDGGSHEDGST